MKLPQELREVSYQLNADIPGIGNKYSPQAIAAVVEEGVDDIVDVGVDYCVSKQIRNTSKNTQATNDRSSTAIFDQHAVVLQ